MNATEAGFAEINGAQIYYEIAGAGQPVVFVHAGIADRRMWDPQFEAFAARYRVLDVFGLQVSIAARGEAKSTDFRQSGRKRNGPLHQFAGVLSFNRCRYASRAAS